MELTLFKKVSKKLFTSQISFLHNNTLLTVSEIKTMRKLNNPTTTSFALPFLTVDRFNLLE